MEKKYTRGTARFLVLTLRLQHLQGGFGSGPGLPLGFGQQLALLLQTLLALLLLLLLLLPALQLQAFLRFKRSALRLKGSNRGWVTTKWRPPAPAAPSPAPPASSAAPPPPSWLAPPPKKKPKKNTMTPRQTRQNVVQDQITQNPAASPPSSWPGLPAWP